jgi:hypothetical protein
MVAQAADEAVIRLHAGRAEHLRVGSALIAQKSGRRDLNFTRIGSPYAAPLLVRRERAQMATLHIEHPISDLQTWLGAFNRFREAREKAGVRSQRVHQPVDDDKYIYVSLDFDTVEEAAAFKSFLEKTIWASAEASPALAGTPKARVLTEVTAAP